MTGLGTGTKILYIVLGIISCIAGVWLFMYPGLTEGTLGLVMGCMMIGYGVAAILSYFAEGDFKQFFRFNLILGIVLIVVGIVLLMNIHGMMNFLGMLVGAFLVIDAALRIWLSFSVKSAGISSWWLMLVLGILMAIVGCYFLFNPGMSGYLLTVLIGAMFISQGAMDISVGLFAM